jgi:hypothetical protein
MVQEDNNQLMSQAISEAYAYGEELRQACSTIGDHFQLGRREEGIHLLQGFLEGIGCISQAIHLTRPIHEEKGLEFELTELQEILAPLVEALEDQDFSLVGDILAYEVEPVLGRWTAELRKGTENASV